MVQSRKAPHKNRKTKITYTLGFSLLIALSSCIPLSKNENPRKPEVGDERRIAPEVVDNRIKKDLSDQMLRAERMKKTGYFEVEVLANGFGCGIESSIGQSGAIVLIPIPSCNMSYKYLSKMTLFCKSAGDIPIPIKARGKTLYWSLKGKTGRLTSDMDGIIFGTFISDQIFDLKSELRLFADAKYTIPVTLDQEINLPAMICNY